MIGIGVDGLGNVFALDEDPNCPSGHIQKYDANGKHLMQVASSGTDNGQFDFNYRGGLAADAKGRLYITDTHSNRIQVLVPIATK
jgi:DNA-binding beta-propeller fold protein YncE